ncbi:MAG: cyclic nucleotide-binding domain-containing protein [Gallionella sp.]|nr:cyclic nucleotide-binding domain-containing protein [Gallionella sp.]
MNSIIIDTLHTSTITENLNHLELTSIGRMFEVKPYRCGEIFSLSANEPLDNLSILARGQIEVKIPHGMGESIVCILYPGDLVELNTFVSHTAHKAKLYAVGDTNILCMSKCRFENLVQSDPLIMCRVVRGIMHNYQDILGRMSSRIAELTDYIYHTNSRI